MQKPTRERILTAAHELMRTVGLARTTTKEIARAAGCSEAALYKHFASKEELFVSVLHERLPRLTPLLDALAADPGSRSVEENLAEIVREAARFYEQSFPIAASLYAETRLRNRHQAVLREMGTGPHMPIMGLHDYLKAEQKAGRIAAEADTFAAASLLLGACAQRSFAYDPDGPHAPPPVEGFAEALVRTVLTGIGVEPGEGPADRQP